MRNICILLAIILTASLSWGVYRYFSHGYHKRPDMPEGAWTVVFPNSGIRGIMVDIENEMWKPDGTSREYLALPTLNFPKWYEDAWTYCNPPTEEETKVLAETLTEPGMRLEALCTLDVDGDLLTRAIIYSIPNL